MFIKDKVAIVTGASSGIGKATAKLLVKSEKILVEIESEKVEIFAHRWMQNRRYSK